MTVPTELEATFVRLAERHCVGDSLALSIHVRGYEKTSKTGKTSHVWRHVRKGNAKRRTFAAMAVVVAAAGILGGGPAATQSQDNGSVPVHARSVVTKGETKQSVPTPTTAAGFAKMWTDQVSPREWGAADISTSVHMKDGRSVWLFGDTLSGNNGFVHSTAITQDGGTLHVSHGGAQLIPNDSKSNIYWIEDGKEMSPGVLEVTAAPMRIGTKSVWDFERTNPKSRVGLVKVDANGDATFQKWIGWTTAAKPFNDMKVVGPHHFTYENRSHPEFKMESGETLWTKAQNWDDPKGLQTNPDGSVDYTAYRPIFYESAKKHDIRH